MLNRIYCLCYGMLMPYTNLNLKVGDLESWKRMMGSRRETENPF